MCLGCTLTLMLLRIALRCVLLTFAYLSADHFRIIHSICLGIFAPTTFWIMRRGWSYVSEVFCAWIIVSTMSTAVFHVKFLVNVAIIQIMARVIEIILCQTR